MKKYHHGEMNCLDKTIDKWAFIVSLLFIITFSTTYWSIVLACFVSFFSSFGSKLNLIEPIFFNKFLISFNQIQFYDFKTTFILNNEWWRLISPMLIHFSPTHLIFNCLWIYVLGKETLKEALRKHSRRLTIPLMVSAEEFGPIKGPRSLK